jgi:hypothetical protein
MKQGGALFSDGKKPAIALVDRSEPRYWNKQADEKSSCPSIDWHSQYSQRNQSHPISARTVATAQARGVHRPVWCAIALMVCRSFQSDWLLRFGELHAIECPFPWRAST